MDELRNRVFEQIVEADALCRYYGELANLSLRTHNRLMFALLVSFAAAFILTAADVQLMGLYAGGGVVIAGACLWLLLQLIRYDEMGWKAAMVSRQAAEVVEHVAPLWDDALNPAMSQSVTDRLDMAYSTLRVCVAPARDLFDEDVRLRTMCNGQARTTWTTLLKTA